jgi:hypothetical protein
MKRNFNINWQNGQEEKCINFDFRYDLEKKALIADVYLLGDTEVNYQSNCHVSDDSWLDSEETLQHWLMSIVMDNLADIKHLAEYCDIDHEIVTVSGAMAKVLKGMKDGRVTWPDKKKFEACSNHAAEPLNEPQVNLDPMHHPDDYWVRIDPRLW